MARLFADALRKCLTKNGCITITDSNAEMSGQLLVAYKGNIYVIDGAFCSFRLYENFIAIGSGGEVARGALYATQTLPPEERLQIACKAAENYCEGVRSPFYILTL
jgi:ATP-dependent protease HslVU (ClpYQ) peptidase subunit